jgi:hypothetical protein
VLLAFLLPIYLYSDIGFDYYATGAVLAVFSLLIGAANILTVKLNLSNSMILFSVFLMIPALILLPYAGDAVLLPLIIIALGSGAGNVISERVVAMEVARRRNKATEASTIYFPYMVGQFVFIAFGGAAVAAFGYLPVFYFFAFLTLYFVIYAQQLFKKA